LGLRWSSFKNKTDAQEMFDIVKDKAFPHLKELGGPDSKFTIHLENAVFIIPTPQLLRRIVTAIDKLLEEMTE
jgi:type I restriction enzyme M protein